MVLLKKGAYAKVWRLDVGENSSKAQISVSKKATEKSFKRAVVNGYENGWYGFVTLIGSAHMMAKTLDCSNGSVTIKVGEIGTSGGFQVTDKDGNKTRMPYQFVIMDFELADGTGGSNSTKQSKQAPKKSQKQSYNNLPDDEDELPF